MIKLDIIDVFDRLTNKWERISGLIVLCLLILVVYYFFLIPSLHDKYAISNTDIFFIVLIPLFLVITTAIIWVFSTNRFFIKPSDQISTGIILIVDEDKEQAVVSKIVKKVLLYLNNSKSLSRVKFRLLPINFRITDKKTEKYHEDFSFMYDLIIRLFIQAGNYNSIEKIEIKKVSITFSRVNNADKKVIFYHNFDLKADMNLQMTSRNWVYEEKNSGIDKNKYFENLREILLYYTGFYAIIQNRFEDALEIMEMGFSKEKTKVDIQNSSGNKVQLKLKPINIAEGRVATILIDLFFTMAQNSYFKYDLEKAIYYMKKLELTFENHPQKFNALIFLARLMYESGNIDQAISYTEQAEKANKDSGIEINLNYGFFAILKEDSNLLCKHYNRIFNLRREASERINWVDIIDFQSTEREKVGVKNKLFDFSIAFIEFVFIDHSKPEQLKSILKALDKTKDNCLLKLGEKALSKISRDFKSKRRRYRK